MKFQLGPLASDVIITAYILVTLFFRFQYENSAQISPINSLFLGASFVMIIYALIKLKILNPNWFGLFKNSRKTTK